MNDWLKLSLMLCVFGFLKEIRPSEPFVTEFITGPWRNITYETVSQQVYPVGTYSYAAQLVVVFLVTDFLRYKPLIITTGISGIIVWCLLLWTTSLQALQIVQFFYGTYMASEVAYYTYMYAKVDKEYYPKVTSHTRAATLSGKLIASIFAQILVYFELMNYRELNYITLSAQIAATIWAIFLPRVTTSLYFHRKTETTTLVQNESPSKTQGESKTPKLSYMTAFHLLWRHFKNAYSNVKVVQWSIWYAAAMCGYLQVITYVQVLWGDINVEKEIIWNGAVDAIATFFGAGVALLAGLIHGERINPQGSLIILAVLSILEGLSILLASWTHLLYVSYIGYSIFIVLYSFTITVASAEVARHLEEESFGLVFGINTLIALILQTVLTFVVVGGSGLALGIVSQYTVYSFYFVVLGLVYVTAAFVEYLYHKSFSGEISTSL